MASAAFLCSLNVAIGLADRLHTVMTTTARGRDGDMIVSRTFPGLSNVTVATVSTSGSGHMVIAFILKVTVYTPDRNVRMVEKRRLPRNGAVTVITFPRSG